MRIAGLEQVYPHIVMVPEPIAVMEFVAFSLSARAQIDSWDDVKNLRVGLVRGWKILEDKTRDFPNVTAVRDLPGLIRVLLAGRVDVVLYDRIDGFTYLAAEAPSAGARMGKVLERRDMYVYLSARRAALAAPLAAEFRKLRSEGFIDKITAEVTAAAFQ